MVEEFSKLRGVTFNGRQSVLAELSVLEGIKGKELTAIYSVGEFGPQILCLLNGKELGFIAKERVPALAEKQFKILVADITGGKGMYNYGCNIKIITE